jgi:hypothetical protein
MLHLGAQAQGTEPMRSADEMMMQAMKAEAKARAMWSDPAASWQAKHEAASMAKAARHQSEDAEARANAQRGA